MANSSLFAITLGILQIVFILLFGFFVDYSFDANASHPKNSLSPALGGFEPDDNNIQKYYPMFQDVHVMIYIGFGFLMTFLKRYGYSAIGLTFLVAAVAGEWAVLMRGFWRMENGKIELGIKELINAEFSAATVLISFGALLGKTSSFQLIVMAFIEIIIFSANEYIGADLYAASDLGGSIFLHTFGAYFGLAVAFILYNCSHGESSKEGANYQSDLFSMIGTVFLWLFWPSFNSAMAYGDARHRAVINTYLSLIGSCVAAFIVSSLLGDRRRFSMVHIQNATLAGGVAVGAIADMMIHPFGALVIGVSAGALSVLGYRFLTPLLARRVRLHDTCGINNLHGFPGILAGIISSIVAGAAKEEEYGYSLYKLYPARAPLENSTDLDAIHHYFLDIEPGAGRSALDQALYQLAALATTILIAIVGGIVTGIILRLPFFNTKETQYLFEDADTWEIEADEDVICGGGGGGVGGGTTVTYVVNGPSVPTDSVKYTTKRQYSLGDIDATVTRTEFQVAESGMK